MALHALAVAWCWSLRPPRIAPRLDERWESVSDLALRDDLISMLPEHRLDRHAAPPSERVGPFTITRDHPSGYVISPILPGVTVDAFHFPGYVSGGYHCEDPRDSFLYLSYRHIDPPGAVLIECHQRQHVHWFNNEWTVLAVRRGGAPAGTTS